MKKMELSVFKTSWTRGFCRLSGGFALPRRQQLPTDTSGRPQTNLDARTDAAEFQIDALLYEFTITGLRQGSVSKLGPIR